MPKMTLLTVLPRLRTNNLKGLGATLTFNPCILPHQWANDVKRTEPSRLKQFGPIVLPPLIDVTGSALVRDGGGKEYSGREQGQLGDKAFRTIRGKVLGDLERKNQVERSGAGQRAAEVVAQEKSLIHHQLGLIDLIAVDAADVFNDVTPRAQPGCHTTANIADASRS